MSSLDEFESILKEVVLPKRLSASKMTKLTEIALKSMEHDTQLVSILYRTHKSLVPPAKVSSLYVFDALSRAARHQVTKQGMTGDINSAHGNCATFLLKVEGVLEGLFQDMIAIGNSEAKEKTRKILDIWVKGNTFPSRILSRLTDVMKETGKVPEMKSLTTSDPRMTVAQPIVTTPPPAVTTVSPLTPTVDPQATLLALLAQAANAAAIPIQTTTNTDGFDAAQLSVLQQLALAQTASSAALSQTSPPQALPPQSVNSFATPSSYREDSYNSYQTERRFNNDSQSSDRVNKQPEDRSSFRGGFRGFRGRGRWDDRDRYRERDVRNDRSPPYRGNRSRSRSPSSRYGGRRDVRPYSPPRRPNIVSMDSRGRDSVPSVPTSGDNTGKDEFGRDIRPQSPESDTTPPPKDNSPKPTSSPLPSATTPLVVTQQPTAEPPPPQPSSHDQLSLSSSVANTPSGTPSTLNSSTVSTQSGLESFDTATFDFTSPASWEALGKMWQVTNGYLPTTEELAQFVMSGGQVSFAAVPTPTPTPAQERGWQDTGNTWRGRGRGGFTRGRGSFIPGGKRNLHENWVHRDNNNETDAIVLGGGSESGMEVDNMDNDDRSGSGGGKMQRLGDKWVFVQNPVTT